MEVDKGSCDVIWDRSDYIMEAEKRLSDKTIYKDVTFNKNIKTSQKRVMESFKAWTVDVL